MRYSIATNWDNDLIDYAADLNSKHNDKIIEFFASQAISIFGSARPPAKLLNIPVKQIEKKIKNIKKADFNFNYLVNSSVFPNIRSKENFRKAIMYFQWIEKQSVDIITIAHENTLSFVSKYFPKFSINLSIVMALKSLRKAERLFNQYPNIKRVTLHQTINRDKKKLTQHISKAHKYKIEVELLANEICLYNCQMMKSHYTYLSKHSQINVDVNTDFKAWCSAIRVKTPLEFLNAPWIRPEDVRLYEDLGVDILKLAGREKNTAYLKRISKAYLERKFDGNVMDLFYMSWWPRNKVPYVHNKFLNGFIRYLWAKNLNRLKSVPLKYKRVY